LQVKSGVDFTTATVELDVLAAVVDAEDEPEVIGFMFAVVASTLVEV